MRTVPILLFASLISLSVLADSEGHMRPFKKEMLKKPIEIPECSMTILEWRPEKYEPNTKPKKENIDIVRDVCKLATDKFPEFATKQGYKVKKTDYAINISFIPFDVSKSGRERRNLNDIEDRFKYRTKFYNDEGKLYNVYGYTERSDDYIYMRNDPGNFIFRTVLAHEICHFLAFNFGVYYQFGDTTNDKMIKDEEFAISFTNFLGLGE